MDLEMEMLKMKASLRDEIREELREEILQAFAKPPLLEMRGRRDLIVHSLQLLRLEAR